VEEVLFSRCENEIRAAIYTLEYSILKIRHGHCAPLNNLNMLWIRRRDSRPAIALLNFPATLFPVSFTGKRLLCPELLTRLQVEGVSLDLLDNVLCLDFPLEAPKGVF